MTRLTSIAKAGYYPIETAHLHALTSYFAPAPGTRLLDPCAGEGEALQTLAQAWQMDAYANELDANRAAACVQKFGPERALQGDLFRLRASNAAFSAVWCNPPYAELTTGSEKRLELSALKHAWKWAQPGGYVFWAVYLHHVSSKAAEWLSSRVLHARLLRCEGLHLGEYPQVILICKVGTPDDPMAMYNDIMIQTTAPELLSPQSTPFYTFPEAAQVSRFMFAPDKFAPEQALLLLKENSAHQLATYQAFLKPPATYAPPPNPCVMPRAGQIGIILAAGMFNGIPLNHETHGPSILRSVTRSVEKLAKTEVTGNGDPQHTITRQIFRTQQETITTLINAQGEILTIKDSAGLIKLIESHRDDFLAYIDKHMTPSYTFTIPDAIRPLLKSVRIKGKALLPTQKHVVAAGHRVLQDRKGVILVGEMGVGKSIMGGTLLMAIAKQRKPGQVCVLMSPPHLIEKWKVELLAANPYAQIIELQKSADVRELMEKAKRAPNAVFVGIVSRERAKLGEGWEATVIWRKRHRRVNLLNADGSLKKSVQTVTYPTCPTCGEIVRDSENKPLPKKKIEATQRKCKYCGHALWQMKRTFSKNTPDKAWKNPRIALSELIAKRYPRRLHTFMCDEVHECKDLSAGQGAAFQQLAQAAEKVIGLTGTLYGGTASSLYGLEWAFNPRMYERYPLRGGRGKWVRDMGILERIVEDRPTFDDETGKFTGTRRYNREAIEKPGASPMLLKEILDHCIFVGLADMGKTLPTYEDIPVGVAMPPDMATEYDRAKGIMTHYIARLKLQNDNSFLSTYLQAVLSWPTAAFRQEVVNHDKKIIIGEKELHDIQHIVTLPGLGEERIYPKEIELIRIVRDELAAGRKVAVFLRQTDTRDIRPRLAKLISESVPNANVSLLGSNVDASKREAYINTLTKQGTNVLICNPELVKTGLDLIAYPSLIFYEVSYSLYTMMQAARRAWRLIQTEPCRTYYLYYEGAMEARAVGLVAKKQQAAGLLMGNLQNGLDELSDDGNSLLAMLAGSIAEDAQKNDLRAMFQKANDFESAWQVADETPEPELNTAPEPPAAPMPSQPIVTSQKAVVEFGKPATTTKKPAAALPAPSKVAATSQKSTLEFGKPATATQKPPIKPAAALPVPSKVAATGNKSTLEFGKPATATKKPPAKPAAPLLEFCKPTPTTTSTPAAPKPAADKAPIAEVAQIALF